MSDLALTGGTYPIKISEKELLASPFTDADYNDLTGYIRQKIMEVGRIGIDNLTPTERSEQLQATVKVAVSAEWGSPEGQRIINTLEGSLRIGWQMIRKKQPRLSYESFVQLARSKGDDVLYQNIQEIQLAYSILNLGEAVNDNKEGESEAPSETTKS